MNRRVVIFDDDHLVRFALWDLFDRRGYSVFTFPDPGLCPLYVIDHCPCPSDTRCADLIVSDVHMTDSNGLDFIQVLIQKGCRQPHFALMSGDFSDEDIRRGAQLGCTLFTKPLDFAKVAEWADSAEKVIPPERRLYDWH